MMAHTSRLAMIGMLWVAAGSACSHPPLGDPPAAPATRPPAGAVLIPGAQQSRAPGEYLVTLAPGADAKAIQDTYGHLGITGTKDVMSGVILLTIRDDPGPDKMEALRKRDARIKAIQPNFVYGTGASGAAMPPPK